MYSHVNRIALSLVVLAVVPYTTLKLLWLSGATIGIKDGATVAEVQNTRMVVGNVITIVLELLAVGLAVALTRPWGRRIPAWIVVSLAGGATGLLAPILLGLPLGSALQLAVRGDLRTGGMDHMSPWVFALVYGGFGLLAIAIATLTWHYTLDRWGNVLSRPPRPPARWATVAGALGLLPFGAIQLWWGLLGPGRQGPQAMDAPAQRTVLVVTGLLAIAAFFAPVLRTAVVRWPRAAWLTTWLGCTVAAMQAPTMALLANGGQQPTPAITVLAFMTIPGSCLYGLAVLRGRIADLGSAEARQTVELRTA